jgi:hypothetical protein
MRRIQSVFALHWMQSQVALSAGAKLRLSMLLYTLWMLPAVVAHTYVEYITSSTGQNWTTYRPFIDGLADPIPQRITRMFNNNSPVRGNITSTALTCNWQTTKVMSAEVPAALSATTAAGDTLTFHWMRPSRYHRGPSLTYLAKVRCLAPL